MIKHNVSRKILLSFILLFSYLTTITVNSATDTTSPTITDYGVESTPVLLPGDKVHFWVKGTDSESGVVSCMMQFGIQGKEANYSYYGTYSAETGVCDGYWQVTEALLSTVYYVDYLSLIDADSNHSEVKLDNVTFEVKTSNVADFIAPVVTGYNIDYKQVMNPGDRISFWIEGTDEGTGIYECNIEWGPLSSPSSWLPGRSAVIEGTRCSGSFTIPSTLENGTYVLSKIYLSDQQGNRGIRKLTGYTFTVTSGTVIERNPPVISSHSIDMGHRLKPGDVISAMVTGYDVESSQVVCSMFIGYADGQWDKMLFPGPRVENNSACLMSFSLPQDFKIGSYRVYKLSLGDEVGNRAYVDIPDGAFEFVSVFDYENVPILQDTSFSPTENVLASSPYDGDMTNTLSVIGSVDTSTLGLSLIKYTVTGKNNYQYRDYRWITVFTPTTVIDESTDTIYFNEPIEVAVPTSGIDTVTLISETGSSVLSGTTSIEKDGAYSVSAGGGSNSADFQTENVSITGISTVQSTSLSANRIKFVIDKTAPIIVGLTQGGKYNDFVEFSFNEGTARLNGKPVSSNTLVSIPGTYSLVVTDRAGNKTTVNFSVVSTQCNESGQKYDVKFIGFDGETLKNESVPFGCSASAPTVSKEGYVHIGWDTEFSSVKSNLLVKSRFIKVNILSSIPNSDLIQLKGLENAITFFHNDAQVYTSALDVFVSELEFSSLSSFNQNLVTSYLDAHDFDVSFVPYSMAFSLKQTFTNALISEITEFSSPVKISFILPETLRKKSDYIFISFNNKKLDLLDTSYDKKTHRITFETTTLSNFVLLYKDKSTVSSAQDQLPFKLDAKTVAAVTSLGGMVVLLGWVFVKKRKAQ